MKTEKLSWLLFLLCGNMSVAQIAQVVVGQHNAGTYKITLELKDAYPETMLLDASNYSLVNRVTGERVQLPHPIPVNAAPGRKVRFEPVEITMNNSYVINYLGFSATVDSTALPKDQRQGIENFEKTKEEMWKSSVTPKIIQSDSTAGILGDLGLDVSISRRIVSSFEFSLAASLTAKKDNPNNKASASLVWRTPILHATNHVAGIRANISIQDDATQSLVFHDLSVRLFASVYLRPFEGIQPIFFTAGLDEASRIRTESGSPNYDDPRIHAQVQWGFIGLLGKGSAFHIDWTYWERLGNLGKPNIDPTEPKKRTFVALEFEYPIATDKNVTVKYADGSVAPTFSKSTSVQLGLQIFLGDWNLVGKE